MSLLAHFEATVSSVKSEARLYPVVVREAVRIAGAKAGCLWRYLPRQDRLEPVACWGGKPEEWPPDTLAAYFHNRKPGVPPDIAMAAISAVSERAGIIAIRCGGALPPESGKLLLRLARRAGESLERLRAGRAEELYGRIATRLIEGLRPNDILYHILDAMHALTGYDHSGAVMMLDDSRSRLALKAEKEVWQKEKSALIGRLAFIEPALADRLLEVESISLTREPGNSWRGSPEAMAMAPLLAYHRWPPEQAILAVPLRFQGKLVGILKISSARPFPFTSREATLAVRLGHLAAAAIDRLLRQTEAQEYLDALLWVESQLASGPESRQVMQGIAREVMATMGYSICALRFPDDRGRLAIRSCSGLPASYLDNSAYTLPADREPYASLLENGKPYILERLSEPPPGLYLPDYARREGIASMLILPIFLEDQATGVMEAYTGSSHVFTGEEIRLLSIFANQAAAAARLGKASARIQRLQDEIRQTHDRLAGESRRRAIVLLPPERLDHPRFTLLGQSDPAQEAGGNFFRIIPAGETKAAVIAGDVTGKGMAALPHMTMAMTYLAAQAPLHTSPARLLEAANAFLFPLFEREGIRADAASAFLDLSTGDLLLSGAGAPGCIWQPAREKPQILTWDSPPLAAQPAAQYADIALGLGAGDRLLFASSGCSEAADRHRTPLGAHGLAHWLSRWRRFSPETILDKFFHALDRYIADRRYRDDLTIVLLSGNENPE
ncbi:MAG: GAF domain-containing protein [Armatimonadetes bacterium]|nr:GAF domain-containing protein [Armatimonadota bacterium]